MIFWADKKAREIVERKKFHYLDKDTPEFDVFTLKSSASISGVLHIGRLSDTIRADAVCIALEEAGYKSKLIWVAEDMDPLRKIPEGIPQSFTEYIGMPVSTTPDPWGCHSSYAEHFVSGYLEEMRQFIRFEPQIFSMREEYSKGSFSPYIKKILEKRSEVIEILNKYRREPLPEHYSPFQPVCKNCGKIITTRIDAYEDGKVHYTCVDYAFEKHTAKGCGYQGEADPMRDPGKLMWKGEWAAQWAHWQVVSEGAGKEYVVPGSAWWINAEICERIFDFPMPVPIFYEHIMIDGEKMSASIGNVVYPREWLEVAPPQLLRFFYNKKLMKTRSFSWKNLPKLYDDYDRHARVYFGLEKAGSEKEEKHMKRLYEISQLGEVEKPCPVSFSHAAMIAGIYGDEEAIIASLRRTGHYSEEAREVILRRIRHARNWATKYGESFTLLQDIHSVKDKLTEEQRAFLGRLADIVEKAESGEKLQEEIFNLAKEMGIAPKKAFQAIYLVTLGKSYGPKAGTFLLSLPRDWTLKRLREAV